MGRKKSRKAVELLDVQLELPPLWQEELEMSLDNNYEIFDVIADRPVANKEILVAPLKSEILKSEIVNSDLSPVAGGTIKKLEFKPHLTPTQMQVFKQCLEIQRRVWNRGLALIEWREWWEKWDKVQQACPDALESGVLPVPMQYHLIESKRKRKSKAEPKTEEDKEKAGDSKWALACLRVRFEKAGRELKVGEWVEDGWIHVPCIPSLVKEHWYTKEPELPKHGKNPYFSLVSAFSKKRLPSDHYVQASPSAWTKGTCKTLGDAWSSYKAGKRKKPRYKKESDKPSSLIHPNSKEIKISNGSLTLPGIGKVRPKGLKERWGDRPACPISITLKGDTVYLQLTGEFDPKPAPKLTGRSIGIDPGVVRLYTDDEGHHVLPPKYLKKAQQKIKRLEDKIDRQVKANTVEGVDKKGYHRRVDKEGWEKKNLQKTRDKLAKEHDKIRRQRRAFNHFHSTKLVRFADEIAIEDTNLRNITKAVKKGESGKPNGRKRKKGLNKSVLDNAIGQFREMIKTKAEGAGRTFRLVPAHKTSQRCSQCGHESPDNRKTQSHFECVACGYTDNADKNAAKNMKQYREDV